MRIPFYSDRVQGLVMGPVRYLSDRYLFDFEIGDFQGQVVWFIGKSQQEQASLVSFGDKVPMKNRKVSNSIKHEMHRVSGIWMRDYKNRGQLQLPL